MGMKVNEARRDDAATCIDQNLPLQILPHSDDVAIGDKDVSRLLTRGIDEASSLDHSVWMADHVASSACASSSARTESVWTDNSLDTFAA
ncbi:unannotated protein [freshwater metagenome]|uniref:Unannotated protein n=1 Tax=freshwater metagenome TaxID=449393 RepID=A0A6J7UQ95_9ZZZZ